MRKDLISLTIAVSLFLSACSQPAPVVVKAEPAPAPVAVQESPVISKEVSAKIAPLPEVTAAPLPEQKQAEKPAETKAPEKSVSDAGATQPAGGAASPATPAMSAVTAVTPAAPVAPAPVSPAPVATPQKQEVSPVIIVEKPAAPEKSAPAPTLAMVTPPELPEIAPPVYTGPKPLLEGWVVYWKLTEGLAELDKFGSLFDIVYMFGYEIGEDGNPVTPGSMARSLPTFMTLAKIRGFEPWVTIVNDIRMKNGKGIMKDIALLRKIFADPDLTRLHARAIAYQTKADGFAGVQIDYELLKPSDTEGFHRFMRELEKAAKEVGIKTGVVIEPNKSPSAPVGMTDVSVMGYNLFGKHSGPGPRATPSFFKKLAFRGEGDVDKRPTMSIATGGFMWEKDGKVSNVLWVDAHTMAKEAGNVRREPASQVPYFTTENGATVYYDDIGSFRLKLDAAREAGFPNVSLWFVGGNDDSLYHFLRNYLAKE